MSMRILIVEADGGSRGNPGVAGYGALVRDDATGEILCERAEPLGRASNNVAEYSGLIAGLTAAAKIDQGATVRVRMDSKLVVEQMAGRWKIKHPDMQRLAMQAQELCRAFTRAGGRVEFGWIPRADNKAADALSNEGMDGHSVHRDHGATRSESPSGDPALSSDEATLFSAAAQPTSTLQASGHSDLTGARVLLVRHGVTQFTEQGRVDGRGGSDPSLSAVGRAQAQAAAGLVRDLVADHQTRLITSSLVRARETGAVIAAALQIEPTIDRDWDEQAFGEWDGRTIAELMKSEPDSYHRLRVDPTYPAPGGESHEQLVARVLPAWRRAIQPGVTSVVVAHRKPIVAVLSELLNIDMEHSWRLATAPCSVTGVDVWADGESAVAFTNRL